MREARPQPAGIRTEAIRLPLQSRGAPVPEVRWRIPALLAAAATIGAWLDTGHRGLLLLLAGATALVAWVRTLIERGKSLPAAGWLVIDQEQVARVRGAARDGSRGKTSLARWGEPFGVSILANTARTRALLAFTTPTATRFIGLQLETPRDADLGRDLLDRAVTIPDADLELAIAPAAEGVLGASAAGALLRELLRRDPQSLRRLYLSDAHGTPIAVEQDSLVIGKETFDLGAPIEWRVFTFHEGEPGIATLYQATAVRQSGSEAVLVCRAPEDVAAWGVGRGQDAAPPRETRVAIDRLFMTPLRAVLEQAPRLSRPGAPPSRDRGRSVLT